MAQVTINEARLAKLKKKFEQLEAPLTKAGANNLGEIIVTEMKRDISKTISPITGKKFEKLSEPYARRKKSGTIDGQINFSNKPDLFLSGKFLNSLINETSQNRDGYSAVIKFSNETSRKKERGHRESSASRPIIPNKSEGFNKRISDIIFNFLNSTVGDIVRKK